MTYLPRVLLLAAVVLIPATASAVTVQEVVSLTQAGVTDDVIVALIARDNGVFPMDAAQVAELKTAGVSSLVVLAMLKSGLEAPPPAESLATAGPQLLIVGHGPDVPNTAATDVYSTPFRFYVPYFVGSVAGRAARARSGPRR
jgi:hypothetical protein